MLLKRAQKSKLSKLKLVPEKIIDQIDLLQGFNKVGLYIQYGLCVHFRGKKAKNWRQNSNMSSSDLFS